MRRTILTYIQISDLPKTSYLSGLVERPKGIMSIELYQRSKNISMCIIESTMTIDKDIFKMWFLNNVTHNGHAQR